MPTALSYSMAFSRRRLLNLTPPLNAPDGIGGKYSRNFFLPFILASHFYPTEGKDRDPGLSLPQALGSRLSQENGADSCWVFLGSAILTHSLHSLPPEMMTVPIWGLLVMRINAKSESGWITGSFSPIHAPLSWVSPLFCLAWSGCNSLEAARLAPYSQWLVDSWISSPPLRIRLLGESKRNTFYCLEYDFNDSQKAKLDNTGKLRPDKMSGLSCCPNLP